MIYVKTDPSPATGGVAGGLRTSTAFRRAPVRALMVGWLVASLSWLAVPAGQAQPVEGQPQQLPTVALTAGFHRIVAMVADDPLERSHGLMWRREMAANEGMLFVFEQPAQQCFWMRNTLIPLSIAFLRDDGTIVNVAEMKPQTIDSHCSAAPVRYALEMNAGWFSRKGLRPGDRLAGPPFAGGR
jgi:uncharacterized membrane protein (UPF0127 family)